MELYANIFKTVLFVLFSKHEYLESNFQDFDVFLYQGIFFYKTVLILHNDKLIGEMRQSHNRHADTVYEECDFSLLLYTINYLREFY